MLPSAHRSEYSPVFLCGLSLVDESWCDGLWQSPRQVFLALANRRQRNRDPFPSLAFGIGRYLQLHLACAVAVQAGPSVPIAGGQRKLGEASMGGSCPLRCRLSLTLHRIDSASWQPWNGAVRTALGESVRKYTVHHARGKSTTPVLAARRRAIHAFLCAQPILKQCFRNNFGRDRGGGEAGGG